MDRQQRRVLRLREYVQSHNENKTNKQFAELAEGTKPLEEKEVKKADEPRKTKKTN